MMKCCIYPNLKQGTDHTSNPYIKDFIAALNASGKAQVVNAPHKNPLISLLARKNWGKVYIFNWFESIPDYKYGPLQAIIACLLILWLKLSGRKVMWVLHNRRPHTVGYEGLKRFLARFISRRADLILTQVTGRSRPCEGEISLCGRKGTFSAPSYTQPVVIGAG